MVEQHLQGMFTVRKYCGKTGQLKQELGPFCNLITDVGLQRVGQVELGISHCYVGTGTAPPVASSTDLGNRTATTSTVVSRTTSRQSVAPYWSQSDILFRFALGAVVGNITEVGVGSAAVPGLWSRELIVDSVGNPVAITVLSTEFLEVTYSVRMYPSTADFSGNVLIAGINYSYTGRTALINSAFISTQPNTTGRTVALINNVYGGPCVLGPVTGTITGFTNNFTVTSKVVGAYAGGNTNTGTSSLGASDGNFAGGITGALLTGNLPSGDAGSLFQSWQLLFSPAIPKTASNTLSLTTAVSWSRVTGPLP